MKLVKMSLAAAMLMGASAYADVDFKLSGQAVLFYQTDDTVSGGASTDSDLFAQGSSIANLGLELNANADLGNGVGVGMQYRFLETVGLEKDLVGGVTQMGADDALSDNWFSQMYLTKALGNTTLKLGRQELPKALSPLAFSEGWNTFKNTFDAIVAINTDIPNTTLVGAYVSSGTGSLGNIETQTDLTVGTNIAGDQDATDGAYMLTVQTKAIPSTVLTASYYVLGNVVGEGADALWIDADIAAGPVKVGAQYGNIASDLSGVEDTTAFGLKVSGDAGPVALTGFYTSVDDGDIRVENVGTNVKTPLYSQMVLNQEYIKSDSDTYGLKAAMGVAGGNLSATYCIAQQDAADYDYSELDVVYTTTVAGTKLFAAYINRDFDGANIDALGENFVRVWARYNF